MGRHVEEPILRTLGTLSNVAPEMLSASGVVAEVSQEGAAGVETNTAEMAEAAAALAKLRAAAIAVPTTQRRQWRRRIRRKPPRDRLSNR